MKSMYVIADPVQQTSPLLNRSVVITRAAHQADDLAERLRQRGAIPLFYPAIAIVPPADTVPLDAALQAAANGAFDWLAFTSTNAVIAVMERLALLNLAPARLHTRIAAVGSATARVIEQQLGMIAHVVAAEGNGSGLADALIATHNARTEMRVLLPQADLASPLFVERLTTADISVVAVTAYYTVLGTGGDAVPLLLQNGAVDTIVFASPSAVRGFLQRLANEGGNRETLKSVLIAVIGKTTASAAHDAGLRVDVLPSHPDLTLLITELERAFHVP